ncbi:MAG TPA: hypothetical protein VFY73_19875 [Ideonella sp.]|uniref:hypothetical protein n=1 Tax=Ideonella sp. TaxID=1929293 RepID=UPI002E317E0B|nr:hypothetical protein [Ideonella sp.]HEX5686295.1 hypothetical protein [Ideonella sp.]
MASPYGAIEGLLIIAGIVALLVWLASVWAVASAAKLMRMPGWPLAGLVYAIATIVAAGVWTARHRSDAVQADAERHQQRAVAGMASSKACLQRAGEEVFATVASPPVVYVHIDNSAAELIVGLGRSSDPSPSDRVQFVSGFPSEPADGAVFVEARSIVEPIPGAEGFPLLATSVEVKSADHKLLARRFDVIRNRESCLSPGLQGSALRRLVDRVAGVDIGQGYGYNRGDGAEILAAVGTVGPIEEGQFQPVSTEPYSLDFKYPGLSSLLAANGCAKERAPGSNVICAAETPLSNATPEYALLAGFAVDGGWMTISSVYAGEDFVDMLDAVKRDHRGAVLARWRIRIPRIDRRTVFIETAELAGSHLTVDFALDPESTSLPSVNGKWRAKTVFRHRARMEADLLPASAAARSVSASGSGPETQS